MKLVECIEEYVRYRRSLGVAFQGELNRLRAFCRVAGPIDVTKVTPEAVRKYLDGKDPTSVYWHRKYQALAGFYRYAISRDYAAQSPLPTIKPVPSTKFKAYIYSVGDMRSLLKAADERHEEDWLMRPKTVRTLLLLLYGTGLRISEALALNIEDVDLDDRVLSIRQTKFYKSRLVPIGDDLYAILRRYRQQHHGRKPRPADSFLVDRRSRRILRQTAELVFKRIREHIGMQRKPDLKSYPRLHDLRHTFAVNRLVSWYQEGKNVQRLLPHLATYLGHRSVRETQHYLHLTSDLSQEAGLRFLKYALPRGEHA